MICSVGEDQLPKQLINSKLPPINAFHGKLCKVTIAVHQVWELVDERYTGFRYTRLNAKLHLLREYKPVILTLISLVGTNEWQWSITNYRQPHSGQQPGLVPHHNKGSSSSPPILDVAPVWPHYKTISYLKVCNLFSNYMYNPVV
jgi:hypothetical protein